VLLLLAWKLPDAHLVGVEAQAASFELLRRNVARNGLEGRVAARHGDLREPSSLRGVGRFELVTGTPPYFPPGAALDALDAQRTFARVERRGGVEAYIDAAVPCLAPDGRLVLCGDARADARVLATTRELALTVLARCDVVPPRGQGRAVLDLGDLPRRGTSGARDLDAHAPRRARAPDRGRERAPRVLRLRAAGGRMRTAAVFALAVACAPAAPAPPPAELVIEVPPAPSVSATALAAPAKGACRFTVTAIDERLPVLAAKGRAPFAVFEAVDKVQVELTSPQAAFGVEVSSGGLTVKGSLPKERSTLFLSGDHVLSAVIRPHPTLQVELVEVLKDAARVRLPQGSLPGWIQFPHAVDEDEVPCKGMAIEPSRDWPPLDAGERKILFGKAIPLRPSLNAEPAAMLAPQLAATRHGTVEVRVLDRSAHQVKVDFDVGEVRITGWVPEENVGGRAAPRGRIGLGRASRAPLIDSTWTQLMCKVAVDVVPEGEARSDVVGHLHENTVFFAAPHDDAHLALKAVARSGYRPGELALLVTRAAVEGCKFP
jgi:hypothetical protein